MYTIYCDGNLIYYPRNETIPLINPVLTMEDSKAGELSFSIPPNHKWYDGIRRITSVIDVYQDGEWLWSGRPIEVTETFNHIRKIECEGELALLCDTIQPQAVYHEITPENFLKTLIQIHNSKADSAKQFTVGTVTVTDPNDSIYRFTNRESTIDCINEKLLKKLGGHLRIRHENGIRYLDYLAGSPRTSEQVIRFGKNLVDFTKSYDMTELATVIVPLGARLTEQQPEIEGLDKRVTIASVNGGVEYLVNQDAVDEYGWIEKVVEYDDIKQPNKLKTKGQKYLTDLQFENMSIELTAVDLHNLNPDIDNIKVLDTVRAVSKPHGLDRSFMVTKRKISITNPADDEYTLGATAKVSYTSLANNQAKDIATKIDNLPSSSSVLNAAAEIVKKSLNGYIIVSENAEAIYIMDADKPTDAVNVWRLNGSGLAISTTGYSGTYNPVLAMPATLNMSNISVSGTVTENIQVVTGITQAADKTVTPTKRTLKVVKGILMT